MKESSFSLSGLQGTLTNNISLRVLRAKNAPLIVSFLHREFKSQNQLSVPYPVLQARLADYLEMINYTVDQEEDSKGVLLLDYQDRAKAYLDNWTEQYFIRIQVDSTLGEQQVVLSRYMEKVFQVLELLQEKTFVGTESKFKDLFAKLNKLVEMANPDKQKRLEELERQRAELDAEIHEIKSTGTVRVLENYQVKEQYESVYQLANELIGDFKEVEDNFKDIVKELYKHQQEDTSKGKMLNDTLDAIYAIRNTDQGKSFYGFQQFLLQENEQKSLKNLTRAMYEMLEERNIDVSSRSLRSLKSLLYAASRKVQQKNDLLATKLSHQITADEQGTTSSFNAVFSSIKQLALSHRPTHESDFFYLEGAPDIHLPMERKLGEKPSVARESVIPEPAEADKSLLSLFTRELSDDQLNQKQAINNVRECLENKLQVTLKEVIETKGLTQGFPELLTYVSLVGTSPKYIVNSAINEPIVYDQHGQRYLDLPQIIFSR